jgi:LL-diaminopimelate aminotransferase
MEKAAAGLGTVAGYSGYGAEQGQGALRQALSDAFYPVRGRLCGGMA